MLKALWCPLAHVLPSYTALCPCSISHPTMTQDKSDKGQDAEQVYYIAWLYLDSVPSVFNTGQKDIQHAERWHSHQY